MIEQDREILPALWSKRSWEWAAFAMQGMIPDIYCVLFAILGISLALYHTCTVATSISIQPPSYNLTFQINFNRKYQVEIWVSLLKMPRMAPNPWRCLTTCRDHSFALSTESNPYCYPFRFKASGCSLVLVLCSSFLFIVSHLFPVLYFS